MMLKTRARRELHVTERWQYAKEVAARWKQELQLWHDVIQVGGVHQHDKTAWRKEIQAWQGVAASQLAYWEQRRAHDEQRQRATQVKLSQKLAELKQQQRVLRQQRSNQHQILE